MTQPDAETMVCIHCEQTLSEDDDQETTDEGIMCRGCYDTLAAEVKKILDLQDKDINYSMAVAGAMLGGIVGAVIWWGFTIVTKYEIGFVAIVIGFTVAKGILMFTGGKRSLGLQILSVLVSTLSYFYANYLVSRSLILAENPQFAEGLGILPSLSIFFEISRATLGVFTVIFLGIVIYQAWQMVAPVKIE